jgi:hypothetical protein
MKSIRTALQALALCLAASPALAADTHKVYNSGILVLAFLGFCALVVVSQLIPSIVLLCGILKEAAQGLREKKTATQAAGTSFFDKNR